MRPDRALSEAEEHAFALTDGFGAIDHARDADGDSFAIAGDKSQA